MKNLKKSMKALLILTLSAVVLSGCGAKKGVTIGVLQYAPHGSLDNCREGFIAGLEEAGYKAGDNVTFDYKNADGEPSNASMIADTFVARNYDLICGIATPAGIAAYNSSNGTAVPVVFSAVSDPVAAEIVKSMEEPGVNCTGTSDSLPLEAQMKLIRAFLPDAKTIGILYTTSEVNSLTHLEIFQELAPSYGFSIEAIGVNAPSDIPLAADTLLAKVDCINNFTDNNVVNNLDTILAKANEAGIPVFGSEEEQVRKGCVAAENINYFELGKETGKIAARILKGEKAEAIPVSVFSDSVPVANQDALELFHMQVPESYADTITYLTEE